MNEAEQRPVSALVAQGWEIVGFSSGHDLTWGAYAHHVLLRRQRAHKLLSIRAKTVGRGLVVKEIEL